MIVDRYDPMNIFEMMPKLELEFEPELRELDRLLEDDELFSVVKADLAKRYPNSERLGRHSTPVEVILRMLLVKRLYGWSYQQTEHFVSDSLLLRQFCRLYLEAAPDDTTLIRWANTIGAQTVAALNESVVELARSLKVSRGRKLRTDGTVVETNLHHPTDDSLLADGVRVIGRLVKRAKGYVEESIQKEHKGEPFTFRDRARSAKRLAHKIGRMARRRKEEAQASLPEVGRSCQSQHKAGRAGAKHARRVALSSQDLRRALPLRAASRANNFADPP
jgi:transposase, IS5 family